MSLRLKVGLFALATMLGSVGTMLHSQPASACVITTTQTWTDSRGRAHVRYITETYAGDC
jgi:hypothetical protein